MGSFENKSVVVTGAAAGIGRATALAFAAEGAQVIVSDIVEDGGHETVALIKQAGGEAQFVAADVAQAASVKTLIDATIQAYGKIDCAVNNAGIEGQIAPFVDQPEDNFDKITAVNLKGTFLCMQAEIKAMLKTGGGAIVNLSSIALSLIHI